MLAPWKPAVWLPPPNILAQRPYGPVRSAMQKSQAVRLHKFRRSGAAGAGDVASGLLSAALGGRASRAREVRVPARCMTCTPASVVFSAGRQSHSRPPARGAVVTAASSVSRASSMPPGTDAGVEGPQRRWLSPVAPAPSSTNSLPAKKERSAQMTAAFNQQRATAAAAQVAQPESGPAFPRKDPARQPLLVAGARMVDIRASRGPQLGGGAGQLGVAPTRRDVSARVRKPPVPKPQERFRDVVDNSNSHHRPKLDALLAAGIPHMTGQLEAPAPGPETKTTPRVARTAPEVSYEHPLRAQLEALEYPASLWVPPEPQPPQDFEETPFTFVDTAAALQLMVGRLAAARELAVDLEHHDHRSFQGITCIMQISTRSEDFVVDTIALRSDLGAPEPPAPAALRPKLAAVFADPGIVKVLHGAINDVLWLQRDFGLFLVNMFDTGEAASVLKYTTYNLAYLLQHFCVFKAKKGLQLSDWRVRPLPAKTVHYARADTHFLLYIYDCLRVELLAAGDAVPPTCTPEQEGRAAEGAVGKAALATVLERSRQLCLQRYEKNLWRQDSYLRYYRRLKTPLTPTQLTVFAGVYDWRDVMARAEDESPAYVLPKTLLLKLAQSPPASEKELCAAVGRGAPLAAKHASELLQCIEEAVAGPQRKHSIDGKEVEVEAKAAAVPKTAGGASQPTRKMFVGGTGDLTDDAFRAYFAQFGEMDDCLILRRKNGSLRGFGFVTYSEEKAVEQCLMMQHEISGKPVEVKRFVEKEDMDSGGGGFGGAMGGGYGGGIGS